MRFVDIAVASGYAAVCLSLIVVISPVVPREAAVEAAAQTRLDTAISSYIQRAGLPFLTIASSASICESAINASNSSLVLDVFIEGVGCGSVTVPPSPLSSTSLDLLLPGRSVVIEAWLARE